MVRAPRAELADLIKELTAQMMLAARDLQFELAARLRDEIADPRRNSAEWTPRAEVTVALVWKPASTSAV